MIRYFILFFFSFLIVCFWPSRAIANVCLHPLEQAALFHGKSKKKSLSARIKKQEKNLEKLQENIENLEESIGDKVDELANSLKGSTFSNALDTEARDNGRPFSEVDTEHIANIISEYIEGQHNKLSEVEDLIGDSVKSDWYNERENRRFFKSNGDINEQNFCNNHAQNKRDCKRAIARIEKLYKRLSQLQILEERQEDHLTVLQDQQFDRELGLTDEEDTEAGAPCWDCLDEVRELDRPTAGQVLGNILSVAAGGALSYYGYQAGKREGIRIDDLRMRQGYDPMGHSHLSWAGASTGLPFISRGIYGLAGGNSVFGNYACSPGFAGGAAMYNPFGHYGMHGGMQMGGGFPGGGFGGGFPGMHGGMQIGGGFPGVFPGGGFGGGGFPGMHGGMQIGGGFPGVFPGGGFGGGFPGMHGGMQIGGGFPGVFPGGGFGGGFPGMHGGMQIGGGFPGVFPGGGFGGGFPGMQGGMHMGGGFPGMAPGMNFQMQYQQQQYAQYMQYQQQQMQARLQAQQAWIQHQQSIQQDWMNRQQVIGSLTQEIYKIQQQIQLVASGGAVGNSVLGASNSSLNTGWNLGSNLAGGGMGGATAGPAHQPVSNTGPDTSGDLPVINTR